jgi:hypothetical protein
MRVNSIVPRVFVYLDVVDFVVRHGIEIEK